MHTPWVRHACASRNRTVYRAVSLPRLCPTAPRVSPTGNDLDDDDIDDLLYDYGYDQDYSKAISQGEYALADTIRDTVIDDDTDFDNTVDDFDDALTNHVLIFGDLGDFDPNEARNEHGEWGSGSTTTLGAHLTGAAIIAEAPVIKPRSHSVKDVAKDLNDRAGRILKQEVAASIASGVSVVIIMCERQAFQRQQIMQQAFPGFAFQLVGCCLAARASTCTSRQHHVAKCLDDVRIGRNGIIFTALLGHGALS